MKIAPTVIIDTREQTPLVFANLSSERGTLASTGCVPRQSARSIPARMRIKPDCGMR